MKSLHPNLTRRGLLAAFAGLASGLAVGSSAGPVAAATSLGTAVIFGDAFSAPTYSGVKSWATQLANKGLLTVAANLAKAGALASAPSGPLSLLGQVDAYLATRPTLPDFTIVYFGTEDLQQGKSLSTAESNYLQAVKKLILIIHDIHPDPV